MRLASPPLASIAARCRLVRRTTQSIHPHWSTDKELDFSAYQQRYVALELLYLGHEYGGFARQEHMEETIEVRCCC